MTTSSLLPLATDSLDASDSIRSLASPSTPSGSIPTSSASTDPPSSSALSLRDASVSPNATLSARQPSNPSTSSNSTSTATSVISRKASNAAAGLKPTPVAHYSDLSFPNTLPPSYLLNLSGASFTRCNFSETQWSRASTVANIHQTNVTFDHCDLSKSNFTHLVLDDCRFLNCDAKGAKFSGCRFLRTTRFIQCDLRNAKFDSGARFWRLEFIDCRLEGASFQDSYAHTLSVDSTSQSSSTSFRGTMVDGFFISNILPLPPAVPVVATNNNVDVATLGSSPPAIGMPTSGRRLSRPSVATSLSVPAMPANSLPSLPMTQMGNQKLQKSNSLPTSVEDATVRPSSADRGDSGVDSSVPLEPRANSAGMLPNLPLPPPASHSSLITALFRNVPNNDVITSQQHEAAPADVQAAAAAATAVGESTHSLPLPLADLLYLGWNGAYFGTGAADLNLARSKAKRSAAGSTSSALPAPSSQRRPSAGGASDGDPAASPESSVSASGVSPGKSANEGTVQSSDSAGHPSQPSAPTSSSSLPRSSTNSSGAVAGAEATAHTSVVGWGRTLLCFQKIISMDFRSFYLATDGCNFSPG
ncbi:hypothetical protein DFJ73DRAFT_815628 [Zopfochytrium polystomum]|nr:hypothetical protein DFJ73DRAFT_815628 [Zopfochytrium polystomum]